jgi:hypothetical protein
MTGFAVKNIWGHVGVGDNLRNDVSMSHPEFVTVTCLE